MRENNNLLRTDASRENDLRNHASFIFVSFAPFAVKNFPCRNIKIGIIGGTGLYNIEGFTNQKWVKVKTPFGTPSDDLLTGKLAGREVVFLPRHGRGHRILPSELNHRANIWAMKKLGVAWIISVSAVGSLQEKYKPCDIVLIDQFFDRTKQSLEHTFFGRGIVAHIAFADPICEELRQIILQTARAAKATRSRRRHLCLHGRPGVQHARRIAGEPSRRLRRHRHDESRRGQMRARSRDRLRDDGDGDRLRLLENGRGTRHARNRSSPTCIATPTRRKKSSRRPSQKFRLNRTGRAIPR